MRDRGERSPGMIVVGERGISRTVADADGYTHGYLDGGGGGRQGEAKSPRGRTLRCGKQQVGGSDADGYQN